MKPLSALLCLALLAACGVDGAPVAPNASQSQSRASGSAGPNVSLSGEIKVGVVLD
ncbi:hypothetical protein [Pseudoruegeria aquimaris]|uniref:hypothetical protein n=1 Tax=Pseudoruegeria aquimaris TaxID=393663 RepID=UPI00159341EA|nr:hypothetical protein [Pseudoruegeria aquimaris]